MSAAAEGAVRNKACNVVIVVVVLSVIFPHILLVGKREAGKNNRHKNTSIALKGM